MTRMQWITVLISMGVAAAATLTSPTLAMGAGSGTGREGKPPGVSVPVEHPVMIQGIVTAVHGEWATVQTPLWRPYCPPKALCSMIIIAGFTYEVNIAQATYEGPSGLPTVRNIAAGDRVVIAGATPAQHAPSKRGCMGMIRTMTADIIEQAAQSPVVHLYKSILHTR